MNGYRWPMDDREHLTDPGGLPRLEERDIEDDATREIPMLRRPADKRVVVPTLRVVAGRDMLRFVTLDPPTNVLIGREEGLGLVLSDPSVSRRHARVQRDERGVLYVQDLSSRNGTAVNGLPVDRAPLHTGDHLEIGGVSLRLDLLTGDEIRHLDNVLARLEANNRDPLTGLLSRGWIDEELPEFRVAAEQARRPSCCLFIDVDRFKSINDGFGHVVGDQVLVGVSRLVVVGVRDADRCVRYGGEELVVFLQGATEQVGYEVAERIRRSIAAHDWSRTAPGLRVTASFGVAELGPGEPTTDWISRADRALYRAKNIGRNTVIRARDPG
jgi:diguanylate cyclase (GGDEF)-like protein